MIVDAPPCHCIWLSGVVCDHARLRGLIFALMVRGVQQYIKRQHESYIQQESFSKTVQYMTRYMSPTRRCVNKVALLLSAK